MVSSMARKSWAAQYCLPEPDKKLLDPKHQFLVPALMSGDLSELHSSSRANYAETLILSTEGLTNHLYDFQPVALSDFRETTSMYDVFAFLVIRERIPGQNPTTSRLSLIRPLANTTTQHHYRTWSFNNFPGSAPHRICNIGVRMSKSSMAHAKSSWQITKTTG